MTHHTYTIHRPYAPPETFEAPTWCDALEQYLAEHPEIPAFPRTRCETVKIPLTTEEIAAARKEAAKLDVHGSENHLPAFREEERDVPVADLAQIVQTRWTADKTGQVITLPVSLEDAETDEPVPVELILTPVRS